LYASSVMGSSRFGGVPSTPCTDIYPSCMPRAAREISATATTAPATSRDVGVAATRRGIECIMGPLRSDPAAIDADGRSRNRPVRPVRGWRAGVVAGRVVAAATQGRRDASHAWQNAVQRDAAEERADVVIPMLSAVPHLSIDICCTAREQRTNGPRVHGRQQMVA
jgi:hypothetical protein